MKELVTISTENQITALLRYKRTPVASSAVRAPRRLESCPAQVFMNMKYSWMKLENMLAANIRQGDIIGVLTYEDEQLPGCRRDVQSDFGYFSRKLRALYRARGLAVPPLIWSMEQSHGDNVHQGRRWHIHFALRAQGEDFDKIRQCWSKGLVLLTHFDYDADKWTKALNITSKILSTSGRGYEPLARYMCKEAPERLGQRTWSYSRSCRKPEIDRVMVDDDMRLEIPEGRILINAQSNSGHFEHLKYIVPGAHAPAAHR